MDIEKKVELLAEILDLEIDEIKPVQKLSDLEEWDSIAVLSFMAMMDEEFGKEMKGTEIKKFVTIQDALDAMEE